LNLQLPLSGSRDHRIIIPVVYALAEGGLSTPSLGITRPGEGGEGTKGPNLAFNSLSRDHSRTLRPPSRPPVLPRLSTPSLGITIAVKSGFFTSVFSNFQLPLSGSRRNAWTELIGSVERSFNSLSRDHRPTRYRG